MSKHARGSKRVCASCDARFYDLGRTPITCPVCQAVYQVPAPSRRSAPAPTPAPAPATKPAAEPQAEDDTPVMGGGAEVISLDEAAAAEKADAEDEEIADIGDDGDDIPDSDDQDAFLEDDEDEDADVTDIVKNEREDET